MDEGLIRHFEHPPASPEECIFAQTTAVMSADLKTMVTPCQFGGDPDCTQCGCMASAGLARIGTIKVAGPLTAGHLFQLSNRIGRGVARLVPPVRVPSFDAEIAESTTSVPLVQVAGAAAPSARVEAHPPVENLR